jgi:RimJ/RimL family protein N-acetyltransferase/GNAT superfamily N-acetyltransferase
MAEARVRLRPLTEADLPNYVRWFNDPEVTRWLMRESGMTLEQEREWFARISSPDFNGVIRAIEAEGRHIGGTALHPDESRLVANFGIHIGEKSCWGKGYGAAAAREMLRIGFGERGLHRIQLETWSDNIRAQRCYLKCGFRFEGIRRQAVLKGGHWLDAVMMAILREEWQASQRPAPDGLCDLGPEHTSEVIALWEHVGLWPHVGEDQAVIRRALTLNRDFACGWRISGRLVGTAIGAWDGFRGWLYRVGVLPAYRRQGIASALVGEVERRLVGAGARQINLMTSSGNEEARAFYVHLGYERSEADLMRKRFAGREVKGAQEPGTGS